jgi:membrane-bound metal-dependent hydrolase YbcI (DUF457 family)
MFRERESMTVFVGHGLFAFALAVLAAEWRGWSSRRALTLGVAAGAFAALPDIDMLYTVIAIDGGQFVGDGSVEPEVFWAAANSVHRSMTHSVVVAAVAGPALGVWSRRGNSRTGRGLALVALAGLVGVAVVVSGALGGIVMGAFVAGGVAVATACRRWTDLSPGLVALTATAGLASHPWGDLLTGQPPQLLYPLDVAVFGGRIALHPDPTIHLLGAFAVELAVIWLAAAAFVVATDRSWRAFYGPSAALGVAYCVAPVLLTPPTLETSYQFVFSILAVGVVVGAVSWYRSAPALPPNAATDGGADRSGFDVGAVGLSGTTIALVCYVLVYLAV